MMFKDVPVTYFGCTHRAFNPQTTIKNVEGKLRTAGVTRITEITHLDRLGIPVYSAIRPSAAEGAVSIYAGKGATRVQAKASAMMEAFERYSAEIPEELKVKKFSYASYQDSENIINPEELLLPPLNFEIAEVELEWMSAINISDDSEYLLPANAVYHPYFSSTGNVIFKSNTNGLASGNVLEEAVYHGITEVIERDAWSIFEAKRKPKPEIRCEDSENPIIQGLLNKFNQSGVDVRLIDITADVQVTTMAAVADDQVLKDPALLTLGVGTHLNPEIAAIRALTEVAQSRATQIHGTREDTSRAVFMRKAGYERMKRINKHWFAEPKEIIDISRLKDKSANSFKDDIDICRHELEKCGIERIFYVDLTRSELKIPVVRVIIPGMEVYAVDPQRRGRRILS